MYVLVNSVVGTVLMTAVLLRLPSLMFRDGCSRLQIDDNSGSFYREF